MKDKFIYLLVGAVLVIGTALLLSNRLKSPVDSGKTNSFGTPTQTTIPKEVPTERPEDVPEDWILFYDREAGYSLYYPPDWNRLIPEYYNPTGLKLWKEGNYRVIELRLVKKIDPDKSVESQLDEVVKSSVLEGREDRTREIYVGDRLGKLIRKPAPGTMDTVIFHYSDSIYYLSLVEGGVIGGGELQDTPRNIKDEQDFLNILNTFQFAE